jgi:hypothetical protein
MKGGKEAALALAVGYVLGRRRKMRLTTMLAAATATGGLGLTGAALRRGAKVAGSSEALGKFAPQLGELAEVVRSDLIDAGKAAASAAVTNRIASLTDSLHERAELVREPGAVASGAGKAARSGADKARSAAGGAVRRRRRSEDVAADEEAAELNGEEDYPEETEGYEAEAYEEEETAEPETRPARRRTTARRARDEEETDEPETRPTRRRTTARRARDEQDAAPVRRTTRRRSPVARAGR